MKTTSFGVLFLLVALAACEPGRSGVDGNEARPGSGGSAAGGGTGGVTSGGTNAATPSPTNDGGAGSAQAKVQIRSIGRVTAKDAQMTMSWPASAVEFSTKASALKVKLTVVADPVGANSGAVAFYLDGSYTSKVVLSAGSNSVSVPGLNGQRHRVTVVKTSEPQSGDIVFTGVDGGALEATTDAGPGRLIEFVGDSISAGWGVDGPQGQPADCFKTYKAQGGADPQVSNAALAAPVLLAQQLAADWSVVAYSGRGVYRNNIPGSSLLPIPAMYLTASPDQKTAAGTQAANADLVVVNLGTNDFYLGLDSAPDQAKFVAAYAALLKAIRLRNPKAPILCVLGPMLSDNQMTQDGQPVLTTATAWVREAMQASGLDKVSFKALTPNSSDVSCEYHPDKTGQKTIATQLLPAIKAATGWN